MRWTGMPMAMWAVFAKSFQTQLTAVLGYDPDTAREYMAENAQYAAGTKHELWKPALRVAKTNDMDSYRSSNFS